MVYAKAKNQLLKVSKRKWNVVLCQKYFLQNGKVLPFIDQTIIDVSDAQVIINLPLEAMPIFIISALCFWNRQKRTCKMRQVYMVIV